MRTIQIVGGGLFAAALLMAVMCAAQDEMPPETEAPPQAVPAHSPHKHVKPSAAVPAPAPAPVPDPAVAAQAPAEEQPHWPVNEQPTQATVTWDSHGLSIDAANSSLQQILKEVSTATGATVDGMNSDERVFGVYGPGQARDVLSQLLQGSGYNVIMVGDQGQGMPRQILLTQRHAGDDAAAPNHNNGGNNSDDDSGDSGDDDPPQPMNVRPGFPGGPPRNPQQFQQMQQERQERLRQLQQQQQNQQNQNPQN